VEFRPDFKKEEDHRSGGSLAGDASDFPAGISEELPIEELRPVNF
jgi:hypothetical protein